MIKIFVFFLFSKLLIKRFKYIIKINLLIIY